MIEFQYMHWGKAPQLAKAPILHGKPKVFELTSFSNITRGSIPAILSTLSRRKGKRLKGSNNMSENAWDHFNYDLLERIRCMRSNDVKNNIRPV